jgi:alpha-ketoglutarate-dependent taurine dioxygenase
MTDLSVRPTFSVRPVTRVIGAEITDIDLATDLDDEVIAGIRSALLTHRVLFFRNQHLDHARQVAFGRRFGELTYAHPYDATPPDAHPEIFTVDQQKNNLRFGGDKESRQRIERRQIGAFAGWHSDVTPAINPPWGSILRAEVVPEVGGDTQWTSLVAAYEGLAEPVKRFVEGLRAEHRYGIGYGDFGGRIAANPLVSHHPVVRVHPETGEKALYVSPGFTSHILDLSADESRKVLQLLFEQLNKPENIVRLRWDAGTVAFWDNRTTAHLAPRDLADDGERRLHRVTLIGDVPVGPDGERSTSVSGDTFGETWAVRDGSAN